MDLFDRIRTNEESLSKMARQLHGYFTYPKLEGPLGAHMKFRGKDILNWNVNDYLGFTQNEEIRRIDEELTRKWGLSYPSGNRIMAGHTSIHEKLDFRNGARPCLLSIGNSATFRYQCCCSTGAAWPAQRRLRKDRLPEYSYAQQQRLSICRCERRHQ